MRHRIRFTLFISSFLLLPLFSFADEGRKLHALFDEDWQWSLKAVPEKASFLGDHRYDDRLTDLSLSAHQRRQEHEREMLARIQAIRRDELDGQDAISYDLFLRDKLLEVEAQQYSLGLIPISQLSGPQFFPVTQLWGPQIDLPALPDFMKFNAASDYRKYLARLASIPLYLDQTMTILEQQRATGWLPPAIPLRSVGGQINSLIVDDARASVFFAPFEKMPGDMDAGRQGVLTEEGVKVIRELVVPALQKFLDYWNLTYYPACRTGIAASDLKGGGAFYAFQSRRETTTDMSPREIHEVGKQEMDRIRSEMQEAITQAGFKGSFQDFTSGMVPRQHVQACETRPIYEMEALALHEAVPGHHLQVSRAQELGALPEFRRNAGYTAYVEGWALYAESLGKEMGFYANPYSRFGQLTYEMWRARRLVVDTGMHLFGWSRQQAIDLMNDNTAKTEQDIVVEIDRYIVWPGQALGYKIGELKIKELLRKARAKLGERFDIRRFHNALLDDGPLPLNILEARIGGWVAGEAR